MKVHCNFDEMVSVSSLKPHEKNRNTHPKDQIKRLAQILEYQGFRYPIKVSKASGFVTSGHGRIEAAKLNGWDKVPVNYQEYESEAQEYADLVADNSIASWSELKIDEIKNDILDFNQDFDIELLALKDFSIEIKDDISLNNLVEPELKEQFIVSVICKNENEMAELFDELKNRNFECKLIT